MKLYEISNQYHKALMELPDSDLDQETISNTLEGLKGDLQVKAKNVAAFISNRKAEIDAVNLASKKLAERAKKEQHAVDSLTEYLKFHMEQSGIKEVRSPELLLKIKKNPPVLVVDNEDYIDGKYFIEVPATQKLDRKAVKQALQDGNDVQGAHIEQKTRLEIK